MRLGENCCFRAVTIPGRRKSEDIPTYLYSWHKNYLTRDFQATEKISQRFLDFKKLSPVGEDHHGECASTRLERGLGSSNATSTLAPSSQDSCPHPSPQLPPA